MSTTSAEKQYIAVYSYALHVYNLSFSFRQFRSYMSTEVTATNKLGCQRETARHSTLFKNIVTFKKPQIFDKMPLYEYTHCIKLFLFSLLTPNALEWPY